MVEQVLGQQTTENRESLLDNLIRQLQNEQDERQNPQQQPEEAEGTFQFTLCHHIFIIRTINHVVESEICDRGVSAR